MLTCWVRSVIPAWDRWRLGGWEVQDQTWLRKENKTSTCGIIDIQDCPFVLVEVPGLRVGIGIGGKFYSGFPQDPRLVQRPI